jgi:transaldolase
LKIKLFADGANQAEMLRFYKHPLVRGFTTNPTLMRQANVADYEAFAKQVLRLIPDRPISFEVFSDELDEMESQAFRIASWGPNVVVKIPVTNTRGVSTSPIVRTLAAKGVTANVTAVMTQGQMETAFAALENCRAGYVSIFAGRIADTGRDPLPTICQAVGYARKHGKVEVIWASPREILNVFQAESVGCHVITMTSNLFEKLDCVGRDLEEFSLDTVRMFRRDALSACYAI